MNREIKFRAWDDTEKKWLLGYDCGELGGFSMMGEVMLFGEYQNMLNSFSLDDWDRIKIMQWTGLKDKNGKLGYHKDICAIGKKLYVIEWQDEEARFWLAPTGSNTGTWKFMDELNHMEIIGNIYQTPKFLNP